MTGPDPEMTSCRVCPDTNRGGAAPSPSSCTSSRTPLARGLPSRRIPPATASTTLPLALSTLVAYVDRDLRASVFPVNVREAGDAYQGVFLIKDVKHHRATIVVEALEQPLLIDQTQEAEFPGPPSDCGTVPPVSLAGQVIPLDRAEFYLRAVDHPSGHPCGRINACDGFGSRSVSVDPNAVPQLYIEEGPELPGVVPGPHHVIPDEAPNRFGAEQAA